jgi:hypothetical protein
MGNLSPAAQRGFFCTLAAGKLGHSPIKLLGTAAIKLLGTAAAEPAAAVVGSAGGDRERGIQQVANVQTRSAILTATAGVVRKAPSFAHGATYK